MQIMTKKQFNFNAILMLCIGSLAFASGTIMLMAPKQEVDIIALKKDKLSSCLSVVSIANMAANPDFSSFKITVSQSDTSNFKYTLAEASFVISECEGFEMQKMCMGTECPIPGYSMELVYSDTAREKPGLIQSKVQSLLRK